MKSRLQSKKTAHVNLDRPTGSFFHDQWQTKDGKKIEMNLLLPGLRQFCLDYDKNTCETHVPHC